VSQVTPAPAQPTVAAAPAPEDNSDFLDEVSVTATRRPTKQRDTTATTYTIKKADFKAQAAVTVTDALQLVPGFIGQPSLGGQRNAGGNFLRGFNDQRFQVLRDGLSLTYPQNGRNSISQYPLDDLDRVEVVTGGATLRYGSGSVGGVINLITETPSGPPKLTLDYQVGSYGYSKYLAKYGGGDDTFSYNFAVSSLVAFNNYPYKVTIPNTAQFYGQTSRQDSTLPPLLAGTEYTDQNGNTRGNSFDYVPGLNDPENDGPIDLFGFLKPALGPATTVQGITDSSYNAADNYTAKLTFKPDPTNKLTFRVNQRNNSFDDQGPGAVYLPACFGGVSAFPNGTLNGDRFLPLNRDGSETTCTNPTLIYTISGQLAFPYNFNTTYNGQKSFPTGQSYFGTEPASQGVLRFQRRNSAQTEISLFHDLDLSPTTALNSYFYYYRNVFNNFRPSPLIIDSNIFGLGSPTDGNLKFPAGAANQPFSDGSKIELQTAINTQLSPGQAFSVGINFVQDRVFQAQDRSRSFFDKSIARSSIFIIDDISFGPELKANIGVRYTYSTQFGSVTTPAIGVRYTPNSLISFRSNWSQVYNAPNIADLAVTGGIFIPNPNIKPETGTTYDIGIDITPASNLGFQLTYFSTYLNGVFGNLVSINPNFGVEGSESIDVPLVQQVNNLAGRRASGIELLGNWQINDQLNLKVSWTNTDVRNFGVLDNINDAAFPFGYEFQSTSVPFNNVAASLTYTNKGYLIALLGRYDSGKRRNASNEFLPSWSTLDLNVEIPVTANFTLTGTVLNLTDTQYEYFEGNPAPGTNFRVGGRLEFGG
jgi:iron complex outermembrane recepter protein